MPGLCCELGAGLGEQNPWQLQTGGVSWAPKRSSRPWGLEAFCWVLGSLEASILAHPHLSLLRALHGTVTSPAPPLTWGSSWKGHSRIQTADLKAGPAHGSAGENLSSSRRALLFVRFCSAHCPSHLTLVTGVLRHVGGTQQCFLTCVWVLDLLQNFMEIDSPRPKWMQTFLHATLMGSYIAIHLVNKYLNGVCQAQF